MKFEIKTVTILMYVALALALGSCTKKTITPAEDPQPAEVGFTASSQAVWVKGGETPTTSFPYDNFGVWGIARHQYVESPYILWSTNQLIEVSAPEGTSTNQETSNVVFTPTTAAYWLGGYEYSFLAIAPYTDPGFSLVGITQASGSNTSDSMSFTYDMSSKYENPNTYTFDLLGGVAKTDGPVAGGRTSEQELTFWHLLSQVSFDLKFGTDSKGQQIDGTVKAVSLSLKPKATYSMSYNAESTQSTTPLHVRANPTASPAAKTLTFIANAGTYTVGPINIVPQTPADLNLTVDFTIKESETVSVDYSLNIDLAAAQIPEEYLSNSRYNYKITIGTNASISFDVAVNQDWNKKDDEMDMI